MSYSLLSGVLVCCLLLYLVNGANRVPVNEIELIGWIDGID